MRNPKIKAVYLDVGGPLVDDSGLDEYWNQFLLDNLPKYLGRAVTLEEILEANRRAVECFSPSLFSYTIWHFVQPDLAKYRELRRQFDALDIPGFYKTRPQAAEICRQLAQDYTLAIAANQSTDAAQYLEKAGILQHFTFKKMSADLPYSKPDLRYFMRISEELGIPLENSVMVGDRQDNDIVPAKRLKMKAIRYMGGSHLAQQARIPSELPDLTIHSISELPEAIGKLK